MSLAHPVLGEMIPVRHGAAPRGWAFAHGQLMTVASMPPLFELIGYTFGGHDTVFALPNLPVLESGLAYAIALIGTEPIDTIPTDQVLGQLYPFKGGAAPRGWTPADGELLPVSSNQALYSVLLNTFGGGRAATFGTPKLPPVNEGALIYDLALEGTYPTA
ncbi:MAG: tail fiber protein [Pseudomonadota bacterium]